MASQYIRPMVGRQRELALIMDRYKAAKEGHMNVVQVSGEPGIGKTCLLDEIARTALQDGGVVLRGGASEAEGMPPYQPILEALGQYIQDISGEQLLEQMTLVPNNQALISLLPELAIRLEVHSLPPPMVPEQARFRLYEALGRFLEVIGTAQALVIILDDLHWADTSSLDLLCHIVRRQQHARILFLGAYRDSELELHPALIRALAEFSRQRVLTDIAIASLSYQETERLALTHLGCACSPEATSLLHTQCEGNPFFAEELLDDWVEMGMIVKENDIYVTTSFPPRELPPNLVAAVRQRFTRFSSEHIDHLRIAAIIGRTFDLSLLAMVVQQEVEAIEESLLSAKHARLVHTLQEGRFTFNHDKIRECLYSEVSTSRRKRLHGVIGHILEAQYTRSQEMTMHQLNELAFHFARSNDWEYGVDYSVRAASHVLQAFAFEEAISHYEIALGLLNTADQRYGDIMLKLGAAAILAGRDEQAEITYMKAHQWFAHQGNKEIAAQAAHGLGLAQWRQEKRPEAYAALQQALALLVGNPGEEAVEILLDLSFLLAVFMESYEEGASYAQQALEMAHHLGNQRLQTKANRVVTGNFSIQAPALPAVPQFLEQLLSQAESGEDLSEATECCLYLAGVYYWLTQCKSSHKVSEHMIELIKGSRQSYQLRHGYSWQALLFASQGKWVEAEQMIALAHPIVDQLSSSLPFAFLCQMRGFLAFQQEDYPTAERELHAAWIGQDQRMSLGESMFYYGPLALVKAAMGKREEAYTESAKLEIRLKRLPVGILPTAPILVCLTLIAFILNEPEKARLFYSDLLAFQGQHYWFLIDRLLGMIAASDREWETATQHLAAAEATARRENLLPELARTLQVQADVELKQAGRGSSLRARALLDQALEIFTQLHMADSAQHTRTCLSTLAGRPPDPIILSLPANLTQHQAKLLNLVAQGKSNREIADMLGLSQKTVNNQLTTIFFKTKTQNRAEATAFAVRHGLA